jgi:hypothetical protein
VPAPPQATHAQRLGPQEEIRGGSALHALRILDTEPEERFDRTRLAQRLVEGPAGEEARLWDLVGRADREMLEAKRGKKAGRDADAVGVR